jgi:hypothetical protein
LTKFIPVWNLLKKVAKTLAVAVSFQDWNKLGLVDAKKCSFAAIIIENSGFQANAKVLCLNTTVFWCRVGCFEFRQTWSHNFCFSFGKDKITNFLHTVSWVMFQSFPFVTRFWK